MRKRKEGASQLLTYDEAAEYLAVGRTRVFDEVARGELVAVRLLRSSPPAAPRFYNS